MVLQVAQFMCELRDLIESPGAALVDHGRAGWRLVKRMVSSSTGALLGEGEDTGVEGDQADAAPAGRVSSNGRRSPGDNRRSTEHRRRRAIVSQEAVASTARSATRTRRASAIPIALGSTFGFVDARARSRLQ